MSDTYPARHSIRIPHANYTRTGGYFLTICSNEMHCRFGRIDDGAVILNPLGEIARNCWLEIPKPFPQVLLDVFVVMPNHVHGILILTHDKTGNGASQHDADGNGADGHGNAVPLQEAFQQPVCGSIPTIVRSYKSAVTYLAGRTVQRRALHIWQSNYYERVLRDDKEYLAAAHYIQENPLNWHRDKLHP